MAKPSASAATERRRRGAASASFPRRAVIAVLAVGLCTAIAYTSVQLSEDSRLALGDVAVAGAQRTGVDAVLTTAALPRGRNVWLLDTSGAARRVEALPWIASAHVQRSWPNQVSIVVTERVAVARLSLDAGAPGGPYALVDADGRVLESFTQQPSEAQLPWLVVRPLPDDASTTRSTRCADSASSASA
jgi:cell division protein FtsQ